MPPRQSLLSNISVGYQSGRSSIFSTVSAAFVRRPSTSEQPELPHVHCRRCRQHMDLKGPSSTAVQRWCDICRTKLRVSASRFSCKPCGRFVCQGCGEKQQLAIAAGEDPNEVSQPSWGPSTSASSSMAVLRRGSSSAGIDEDEAGSEDDRELCIICFAEPDGVMLLPCRHENFCQSCSLRLRTCPLCNKYIEARVREKRDGDDVEVDGRTEIHRAAEEGRAGDVERCIAQGAPVDLLTDAKLTPLHIAASQGHSNVARCLISAGALVSPMDTSGSTPLHYAASYGKNDIVDLLLASGRCDVNAPDAQTMTPLHWAARMAHEEIAIALICAGADLNAKSCHSPGYTPFAMAEDWGTSAITELLRINGGHR